MQMKQKQQISTSQAIFLVAQTIAPTAILVVPTISIGAASQDAWISIVIAWIAGIGMALLFGSISRRNPGVPFLSLVEDKLGRTVGIITGICFVQYYLGTMAVVLREFVDFLSSQLLPKTPVTVIAVISMIVVIYAVSKGIEVLARISVIVFVVSMIFLGLGVGLQMNQIHLKYLFPVADMGITQIVSAGLPAYGWFSEAAILLLLSPYLNKPAQSRAIGIAGMTIAGGQLLTCVLLVLTIFGPELPKLLAYPTFATAEVIKYGAFIERVDIMFICIWIASVYIKLCVFFFGTVHCMVHLLRIRAQKPFHVAIGILVILTALYSWPNHALFSNYQQFTLVPFLISANLFLPVLLWIGMQWKGSNGVRPGGS